MRELRESVIQLALEHVQLDGDAGNGGGGADGAAAGADVATGGVEQGLGGPGVAGRAMVEDGEGSEHGFGGGMDRGEVADAAGGADGSQAWPGAAGGDVADPSGLRLQQSGDQGDEDFGALMNDAEAVNDSAPALGRFYDNDPARPSGDARGAAAAAAPPVQARGGAVGGEVWDEDELMGLVAAGGTVAAGGADAAAAGADAWDDMDEGLEDMLVDA